MGEFPLTGGTAVSVTRTVLVIDDDEAVRTLARMVLERAGFAVSEVGTAAAGLAAVAAGPEPDVIVLDLTMPGLSGPAAVRAVRTAAPNARLVVASGHERPDELDDVEAVFLAKPYRPDGLVKAVGG